MSDFFFPQSFTLVLHGYADVLPFLFKMRGDRHRRMFFAEFICIRQQIIDDDFALVAVEIHLFYILVGFKSQRDFAHGELFRKSSRIALIQSFKAVDDMRSMFSSTSILRMFRIMSMMFFIWRA